MRPSPDVQPPNNNLLCQALWLSREVTRLEKEVLDLRLVIIRAALILPVVLALIVGALAATP